MITFADLEEVTNDTTYFQDQCLDWSLHECETKYKDINMMLLEGSTEVNPRKHERVDLFHDEVSTAYKIGEDSYQKIKHHYDSSSGRKGRKEEEEFWGKLEQKAKTKLEGFQLKMERLETLKEAYDKQCGSSKKEKAIIRKKQKNVKKVEKRKATWEDKRLRKKKGSPQLSMMKYVIKTPPTSQEQNCRWIIGKTDLR